MVPALSPEISGQWFRPTKAKTKVGFGVRLDDAFDMTRDGFNPVGHGLHRGQGDGLQAIQFWIGLRSANANLQHGRVGLLRTPLQSPPANLQHGRTGVFGAVQRGANVAPQRGAYRGHEFTAYYLNEEQALLVCTLSRTPVSKKVRAIGALKRGANPHLSSHCIQRSGQPLRSSEAAAWELPPPWP